MGRRTLQGKLRQEIQREARDAEFDHRTGPLIMLIDAVDAAVDARILAGKGGAESRMHGSEAKKRGSQVMFFCSCCVECR